LRYKLKRIGDIIDEIAMGPFGSNIKVDSFVPTGVPVLNGSNLTGFTLNEENFNYVTPEKAASLKKAIASRGDVVITHRGTLGQIAYIPKNSKHERYVISQSQFRVRCDDSKMLPEYMVYYFHSRIGKHQLLSNSSQVGVPALARPSTTFQELEMPVPPLVEQKTIVNTLTALDDRIANNRAINHHLEQMAQAIFKSWFVDFEPWGGVMPDDWEAGVLGDVCTYNSEKVPLSTLTLDTYISTENMSADKGGFARATNLPTIVQTTAFAVGDTLVSNIRPYFKKIVYCGFSGGCSTDVLCFRPQNSRLSHYIYYALYGDSFFDYMVAGSKGTKMPRGDKQQIMTYPVAIPTDAVLDDFICSVAPMAEKRLLLTDEITRLATLRDTLLPRLMSGELSVADLTAK